MSIKLPSKKIQALIIIVVALFAGYFLYVVNVRSLVLSFLTNPKSDLGTLSIVKNQDNLDSNIDTDKDSLKDWQEVLWGTDKNNPDTDGDGTSDGDEVAAGRDPLIKGPNDNLTVTRGVATSSVAALSKSISEDSTNVTATLSKTLFTNFMMLQSSGGLDAAGQEKLIASTLANIDPGSIPPKYNISDINVVSSNATTFRSYGNQLAKILSDLNAKMVKIPSNDVALTSYQQMIDTAKKIPVPSTLGITHLQILNNFNISYQTLSILNDYQNDPAKALIAMNTFKTNGDDAKVLFTSIAEELKKNGIIFTTNESGNIWNNY
ncbi:MAG: thrombospondin type 3 repeat-containing protein [Candidatus Paceibacterota bacterium]